MLRRLRSAVVVGLVALMATVAPGCRFSEDLTRPVKHQYFAKKVSLGEYTIEKGVAYTSVPGTDYRFGFVLEEGWRKNKALAVERAFLMLHHMRTAYKLLLYAEDLPIADKKVGITDKGDKVIYLDEFNDALRNHHGTKFSYQFPGLDKLVEDKD